MKRPRSTMILGLLGALAAISPHPCGAMAVAGPGGGADPGQRIVHAAPAVADAQTLELISAVIDEVQSDRGQIVVRGKPVALHPTRLKVLQGGQSASAAALRPGQSVRFALDTEPSGTRSIVHIQIDH